METDDTRLRSLSMNSLIDNNEQPHMMFSYCWDNKDNVKHLLSKITPYAIDVSRGVEIKKGKKDYQMMEKFILGVRNATL